MTNGFHHDTEAKQNGANEAVKDKSESPEKQARETARSETENPPRTDGGDR